MKCSNCGTNRGTLHMDNKHLCYTCAISNKTSLEAMEIVKKQTILCDICLKPVQKDNFLKICKQTKDHLVYESDVCEGCFRGILLNKNNELKDISNTFKKRLDVLSFHSWQLKNDLFKIREALDEEKFT